MFALKCELKSSYFRCLMIKRMSYFSELFNHFMTYHETDFENFCQNLAFSVISDTPMKTVLSECEDTSCTHKRAFFNFDFLVSWCFEPSQPKCTTRTNDYVYKCRQ